MNKRISELIDDPEVPISERRRRSRLQLRWPIALTGSAYDQPINGILQNMSSDGMYCLFPGRASPGQIVQGEMELPPGGVLSGSKSLECRMEILRVDLLGDGVIGIACRVLEWTGVFSH